MAPRIAPGRGRMAQVCILLLLTVLVGCTQSVLSPHDSRSEASAACVQACAGTLDGAVYVVREPAHWNGTLLIYSHGLAASVAGLQAEVSPDDTGWGTDTLTRELLAKGYALAASAFPQAGWDVASAMTVDGDLYRRAATLLGTPRHVIAWGSSLGGLITELLAERASWVSGAVALCGAVAGPLLNADNLDRALLLVSAVTGTPITVSGGQSETALTDQLVIAGSRLSALVGEGGSGAAEVIAIAGVLGLPLRSVATPADSPAQIAVAAAQNIDGYLQLAAAVLSDMTRRYGGNVTDPRMSQIGTVPAASAAAISALGGSLSSFLATFRGVPAPTTVTLSRAKLAASGDPTGRLRVPLITVHGQDDPLTIPASETVLAQRVAAAGKQGLLRQIFVAPQSDQPDPSYGVGHCVFSTQQQVGAVVAMQQWLSRGSAPSALAAQLGKGADTTFQAPDWPTPTS